MIKSRIKYYLDKNNMTQRELAEKTGMTETSISRYVSGIRIPRATECIEIAKVLGCKAEDLFIKVDEESAKEPVCEWKFSEDFLGMKMYEMCDGKATVHTGYKFCPYCGNKIEVIK